MKKETLEQIEKTAIRYASKMGYSKKEPLKEMSMREMLGKMRSIKNNSGNQNKVGILNENRRRHQYLGEEDEVIDNNNQNVNNSTETHVSPEEQKNYERNMSDYFNDDNVTIKYEPILIAKDGIFWAGTIDGQLKFAYMVTPDESTSGVKIERSPDFDPNNIENIEIEKKIVEYYDSFYEYWSKNQLEK
jgi:hypothetical protein